MLKTITIQIVWIGKANLGGSEASESANPVHTIILGALEDEGCAGDPVPDAGECQHLELIQHELAQAGQQCRPCVVPSHSVTSGLRIQVFCSVQNLKHQHTSADSCDYAVLGRVSVGTGAGL